MYLHRKVHIYILGIYVVGFHHRNDGFLDNGITVSYDRTAGTQKPEYSGNRKLWSKVQTFIDNNYDTKALRKIFVSGDGAAWIKYGANYLDKAVFCADKYHLMKYVNTAAAQMLDEKDNVKNELWHLLNSKSGNVRKAFDTYTNEMMRSAKSPDKIEDLRKYVLGNWAAVRRTLRNKLVYGCSAESHVSHVLSDRLSSRPMGWSQTGADRMSKLRCYDRNNGKSKIIQLVKYVNVKQNLTSLGKHFLPCMVRSF